MYRHFYTLLFPIFLVFCKSSCSFQVKPINTKNEKDLEISSSASQIHIIQIKVWREIIRAWSSNVILQANSDSNLLSMCQLQVHSRTPDTLDILFHYKNHVALNSNNVDKVKIESYASVQILTKVTQNQNQSDVKSRFKCAHVLHFSLHCVNALIFVDEKDEEQETESLAQVDYSIRIIEQLWDFLFKTGSPRFTHHIFVGKRQTLEFLLYLKEKLDVNLKLKESSSEENLHSLKLLNFIQDLKHKTGIAIDDFDFDIQDYTNENTKSVLILNPDFIQAFPQHDLFTTSQFQWKKFTAMKFGTRNVRNRHLRVDGFPMALQIIKDQKGRPYAGATFETLEALSRFHNLTYTLTFNHFRNLGRNPKNPEKWDGFIGALEDDLIDVAFFMADTVDRHPYATLTTNFIFWDLVFFTALPEVRVKWQAIVYPFEPSVWFLILLSVAATVPIFYAQQKLFRLQKPQSNSISTSKSDQESNSPFFSALILPICALLMESFPAPKNRKMRPLLGLFLFYSIIVGVFYNSNLISFLTFPEEEKYPKTFSDVVKMPEYHSTLNHYPGSPCDIFFQRTTNPTFLEIKRKLKRDKSGVKCLISAALEQKPFPSVCFGWDNLLKSHIAKNLTLMGDFGVVTKSTEKIMSLPIGAVLKKESKYLDVLSSNIGALRDTGHYEKWFSDVFHIETRKGRQWIKKGSSENARKVLKLSKAATESECKPFTMVNFTLAFACIGFGAAVAILGFFVEILSFNCQQMILKLKLAGEK